MIMIKLAAFFGSLMGRVTLAGVLILGLIALRANDVAKQRRIGESRAVEKIEKANTNAVQIGKRAAARSSAPGVRGERDPTTRND